MSGMRVYGSLAERFMAKLPAERQADQCWNWSSLRANDGYGQIAQGGAEKRMLLAHRVAYTVLVGPIPHGLDLDHLCRNRACVNPAHLDPVTRGENTRRGMAPSAIASRTDRCKRGHSLSEHAYVVPKTGKRLCRACRRTRRLAGAA